MSIDPETIGTGAGGSLFGALMAWLGIKGRIDKQDKEISSLKNEMLLKNVFIEYKEGVNKRFDHIDKKLDNIWEKLNNE